MFHLGGMFDIQTQDDPAGSGMERGAGSTGPALLADRYRGMEAPAIVRAAVTDLFPGNIAVTSSFGAESVVLLSLVADVAPETPVLFFDTGKLFPETVTYLETVRETLGLTDIRRITPDAAAIAEADPDGDLWRRDPDACCRLRKSEPQARALQPFDAWFTGRKRFQASTRASLPRFETLPTGTRINPLADWDSADIQAFMDARDLPRHPLVAEGYASIGCAPCTTPVADGEDPRAGRWRGREKTECGIHWTEDGAVSRLGRAA